MNLRICPVKEAFAFTTFCIFCASSAYSCWHIATISTRPPTPLKNDQIGKKCAFWATCVGAVHERRMLCFPGEEITGTGWDHPGGSWWFPLATDSSALNSIVQHPLQILKKSPDSSIRAFASLLVGGCGKSCSFA